MPKTPKYFALLSTALIASVCRLDLPFFSRVPLCCPLTMCGNMDFTGRPTKGFRATGKELKKHEGETSSATKTSRGFFADTDPGGSGALISLRSGAGQGRPLPVSISEFPSAGPTGWHTGTPSKGFGAKRCRLGEAGSAHGFVHHT